MSRVLLVAAALIALGAGLVPVRAASAHDLPYASRHQRAQAAGWGVEEVGPNTPAARAGIRPGDRITAIDGRPVNGFDDIARQVERSRHAMVVEVERAGRHIRLSVAPRALTR